MAAMESFWVSVSPLPMINNIHFEIKHTERFLYPFLTKIGKSAFFDVKKSLHCILNRSASTYARHNNIIQLFKQEESITAITQHSINTTPIATFQMEACLDETIPSSLAPCHIPISMPFTH